MDRYGGREVGTLGTLRAFIVGCLAAGLCAAAPVAAEPAQNAAPEASVAVSVVPRTGLVDNQGITISGTGFSPGEPVYVEQCRTGRPAYLRCDDTQFDYAIVQPNGTFSMTFHVAAVLETVNGPWDCRPAALRCDLRILTELSFSVRKSLTFVPGSPLAPNPELAATPNTGLVDGQIVEVAGSALRPNREYTVWQCIAGAFWELGCDFTPTFGQTDAQGKLVLDMSVTTVMHTEVADVDCRRNECELVTVDRTQFDFRRGGRAPIAFDPAGSLLPPPTLEVTPDTGLTGRQVVQVNGTGFRPLTQVHLAQCKEPAADPWSCHVSFFGDEPIEVAEDGSFTTDFMVRRRITYPETNQRRDCGVRPCAIVAWASHATGVVHPISFVPL